MEAHSCAHLPWVWGWRGRAFCCTSHSSLPGAQQRAHAPPHPPLQAHLPAVASRLMGGLAGLWGACTAELSSEIRDLQLVVAAARQQAQEGSKVRSRSSRGRGRAHVGMLLLRRSVR